ncbi:MAG TPA: glycosyltransferase [Candidatus Paceibacterota bacterium]|nr:glycosyltransferase [Candidatus Paceibacterota bacterium]HRZ34717.1 glycosyltransferase [Candidatus Paceibacterota bacterium]
MRNKVQKILYLITKSNWGGAQKSVFGLATEMSKLGKEVLVVLGGNGILKDKLEQQKIRTFCVNSLERDVNILGDFKSFFKILKIFREEKPDIIHLNSSKAGGLGALAGRIANLFGNSSKIVFSIRGWAFNEKRGWLSKIFIKQLYWAILFLSHVSIAVSEATKRDARKLPFYFLVKNKIKVVKNSIREVAFIDKEVARKFIGDTIGKKIDENTLIIGALAELHKIKGLNYFIEAYSLLKDAGRDIVGVIFGAGEEKEALEKLIAEKNLKNGFFLGGELENAAKYLKGFDIYVSSSLSEGLSLVLLEARQAGLKIVATNVGGNLEALSDYQNCEFVEAKNPAEMAQKIKILADKKNSPEEKKYQSFSEMIAKILEIYSA